MFENFEGFTYSSAENFPAHECTIQNDREPNVFESGSIYQVLYINVDYPEIKRIVYAHPYICMDEDGKATFGWISTNTSEVFGNIENSCQLYDEFVVGFIPSDNDYQTEDLAEFNKFKSLIDAQWDD